MKLGDTYRKASGEGKYLVLTDSEGRRHRERRGLDTLVVYAVKYIHSVTEELR